MAEEELTNGEKAHPGNYYEEPAYEAHSTFDSLKQRITDHYNIASDYYHSLWGQHIHHGLFIPPTLTKEEAQTNLIKHLLEVSALPEKTTVLDVGCGIGGTTRYLAKEKGCNVTGITISAKQVEIANRLSAKDANSTTPDPPFQLGSGTVSFLELDAEKMLTQFTTLPNKSTFNCIWITEALSHLPNKPLFFASAHSLLHVDPSGINGRLVIADWFRSPASTPPNPDHETTIKTIEDGMLLPSLFTMNQYIDLATSAGFTLGYGPEDISKDVAKTWDISWELVSNPALWGFAVSQGRDGLAFLQAFRAMRRGYAEGSLRYGVLVFEKVE